MGCSGLRAYLTGLAAADERVAEVELVDLIGWFKPVRVLASRRVAWDVCGVGGVWEMMGHNKWTEREEKRGEGNGRGGTQQSEWKNEGETPKRPWVAAGHTWNHWQDCSGSPRATRHTPSSFWHTAESSAR